MKLSKIFLRGLLVVVLILLIHTAYGQSDSSQILSLSLQDARDYALKNNLNVKSSEKNIAISERQMKEIVAQGLPQIDANIKLTDNLMLQQQVIQMGDEVQTLQFGTQYNMSYSGQVNQLIFNGSYIVGVQTAKIYRELSQVQHKQNEVDALELVNESYYNVLVAYESKMILEQNVANLKQTLVETQKRYKEGFVEITDVDQLQISVNRMNTSLKALDNQTEVAEQLLKFQLGTPRDAELNLTSSLDEIVAEALKMVINRPTFNVDNNISFQLSEVQVQMQKKNLTNEKTAFLPSLNAFGQYGRSTMRDKFNFSGSTWYPSSAIGLSLDIPIFSGGGRYQKVKIAQLELEQSKIQQDQLERSLLLQNKVAVSNLESTYLSFLDDKSNMELSLKVYNRTQIKYNEGMTSSLDLIQTYDQFLNTQNTYISRCSELMKYYNVYDKLITNFGLK